MCLALVLVSGGIIRINYGRHQYSVAGLEYSRIPLTVLDRAAARVGPTPSRAGQWEGQANQIVLWPLGAWRTRSATASRRDTMDIGGGPL